MRISFATRCGLTAALVVAAAHAGASKGAPPEAWRAAVMTQPAGTMLRVGLADGGLVTGPLAEVTADSVIVGGSAAGPRRACALLAIERVERLGGGAARGWRTGSIVGTIVGGLTGLFAATVVDAIGEGDENVTTADYAAAGVAFATAGAVAVGGLGALVASGGDRWYAIAPAGPLAPPSTTFSLQAGLAAGSAPGGDDSQGLHLRGWLPHRFGSSLVAGPEMTYSAAGGTYAEGGGPVTQVHDTGSLGLAGRLAPTGTGLAPFLSAGLGWYHRDDDWLGLNLGLGLLWRTRGGTEWIVEMRRHTRASGLDAEPSNSITSVAVGWTLGR